MASSAGATVAVSVVPRAAENRIGPYRDGILHVRVTRPPADGEATRAVQRLLADALGVAPGRVVLTSGRRSRQKHFRVDGLDSTTVGNRLRALDDGATGT